MIKIPQASDYEFTDLRNGIARCIQAVIPSAIVYNNWAMKYGLEETISLLTGPEGYIHAWLISISEMGSLTSKGGAVSVGEMDFPLTVRIWGFIGNSYGGNIGSRQDIIERECKEIVKVLWLNQATLGMNNPKNLAQDKPLGFVRFTDIDVKPFGSGDDIIVAEGFMDVTWREWVKEQF